MTWTPVEVAIVVGWALNAELLLVIGFLRFLPFRWRRMIGYLIATLIFACLWQWRGDDPAWDFDLIAAEACLCNLAVMYFLKAYYVSFHDRLGRAMAINNYTLSIFFIAAQFWMIWDGGRVESMIHLSVYAIVLITVNRVIDALLDPETA